MCGIAGIVNFTGVGVGNHQTVKAMADAMQHRGPDGEGFYDDDCASLGHRRLSVIDIDAGQQPMLDQSNRYAIVFNGEIYNHRALRAELETLGCSFQTQSDTEVLLYAYIKWQHVCVERLNGMFAFAIWDKVNKSLFMARDRLGIKPLYYAEVGESGAREFVFASEFSAILCHQKINRDIRVDALEDYLALGYVPDPKTIIAGVHKLPPGYMMFFDAASKECQKECYWNPYKVVNVHTEKPNKDWLANGIEKSVLKRMIADVPLGSFLSGGVDSSIITGMLAKHSHLPVKASTIGSNIPQYDESDQAHAIANHLKLDHRILSVDNLDGDILDLLTTHFGEPFADHSAVPTYYVSKLAREEVTVSLSGDGADELFGGYRRYKMHLFEEKVRRLLPLWLRRPLFGIFAYIYPKLDRWPRFLRAKSTFESLAKSEAEAYFNSVSKCPDRDRLQLYSQTMKIALKGYHPVRLFDAIVDKVEGGNAFRRIQMIDLMTYLPGDILTKLDRMSMACSLEARVPYLDHELVEKSLMDNSDNFFDKGKGKAPLHSILAFFGLETVFDQPKKGFVLPIDELLRTDLRAELLSLSKNAVLEQTGLLDMAAIQTMVSEHLNEKRDHQQILWSLLILKRSLAQIYTKSTD
jgi:asparagine synthase (glutamine-hydrolysing)